MVGTTAERPWFEPRFLGSQFSQYSQLHMLACWLVVCWLLGTGGELTQNTQVQRDV